MSQPYGHEPDPRHRQWGPPPSQGGQWRRVPDDQRPSTLPAAPRANVVAIIGVVFGALAVFVAFGLGGRYISALLGAVALVLGLIGDGLSRRGHAGGRMGVLAAALGVLALLPAFG